MNLLMIGFDRDVFSEGSEARSRLLMQSQGFDSVHLIVFSRKGHRLGKISIGSNVWLYPTDSLFRLLHVVRAVKIGKGILKKIKGETVISAQDPFESGLAAFELSKSSGLPLHIQIHTDFLSPYFKQGSFLNSIRVRIAKYILPYAKGLRVVSEHILESLVQSGIPLRVRPVVLPVFIEIERFKKAQPISRYPQFKKIILSVARLSREKDLATALEAFKKIKEALPEAGLVIIGDGPEREKLGLLAEALGVSSSVVFEGKIPSTEIPSYYRSADVYIQTSLYEGFGRTYIEAGIAGCPIVSTKAGIAEEIGALVCPVGDSDCISSSVVSVLTDNAVSEKVKSDLARNLSSFIIDKDSYANRYAEAVRLTYEK